MMPKASPLGSLMYCFFNVLWHCNAWKSSTMSHWMVEKWGRYDPSDKPYQVPLLCPLLYTHTLTHLLSHTYSHTSFHTSLTHACNTAFSCLKNYSVLPMLAVVTRKCNVVCQATTTMLSWWTTKKLSCLVKHWVSLKVGVGTMGVGVGTVGADLIWHHRFNNKWIDAHVTNKNNHQQHVSSSYKR